MTNLDRELKREFNIHQYVDVQVVRFNYNYSSRKRSFRVGEYKGNNVICSIKLTRNSDNSRIGIFVFDDGDRLLYATEVRFSDLTFVSKDGVHYIG